LAYYYAGVRVRKDNAHSKPKLQDLVEVVTFALLLLLPPGIQHHAVHKIVLAVAIGPNQHFTHCNEGRSVHAIQTIRQSNYDKI
jgi:hypothetical protein